MFKMFCIYPFVVFVLFWLASDIEIGASVYSFNDNYITLEFPKESLRSEENPDPWYSFYWNAESAKDSLKAINDAVVE